MSQPACVRTCASVAPHSVRRAVDPVTTAVSRSLIAVSRVPEAAPPVNRVRPRTVPPASPSDLLGCPTSRP